MNSSLYLGILPTEKELQISKNSNMMLNHKQEQIKFRPADDGFRSSTFKALFKWS